MPSSGGVEGRNPLPCPPIWARPLTSASRKSIQLLLDHSTPFTSRREGLLWKAGKGGVYLCDHWMGETEALSGIVTRPGRNIQWVVSEPEFEPNSSFPALDTQAGQELPPPAPPVVHTLQECWEIAPESSLVLDWPSYERCRA